MFILYTGNFHPDFVQGLVRDIRVRWALEEAEIPYQTVIVSREDLATPEYRARHPFGKIPSAEDDGVKLFESSAIVLHVAERSEELMPRDPARRARTLCWALAAAVSIEYAVNNLCRIDLTPANAEADKLIRPTMEGLVKARLGDLSVALGDKDYLEGDFTCADLLMFCALNMMRHCDLAAQEPVVRRYMDRCEQRPAYQRAMQDHMAVYEKVSKG